MTQTIYCQTKNQFWENNYFHLFIFTQFWTLTLIQKEQKKFLAILIGNQNKSLTQLVILTKCKVLLRPT